MEPDAFFGNRERFVKIAFNNKKQTKRRKIKKINQQNLQKRYYSGNIDTLLYQYTIGRKILEIDIDKKGIIPQKSIRVKPCSYVLNREVSS